VQRLSLCVFDAVQTAIVAASRLASCPMRKLVLPCGGVIFFVGQTCRKPVIVVFSPIFPVRLDSRASVRAVDAVPYRRASTV